MIKTILTTVVMVAALAASQASAVTVNFSFSSDLSDPQATNKIPGTITGHIDGLVDNATSAATAIFIDSYPAAALGTIADPSYVTPVNVAAWSGQFANSFTLVGGVVTAALFHSNQNGPGGFDQFWLNVPLGYINGNTNYFDLGNGNRVSIWNNNGFAGVTFGAGGTVPEPTSWAMMIAGFGLVGAAMRRRAIALAA